MLSETLVEYCWCGLFLMCLLVMAVIAACVIAATIKSIMEMFAEKEVGEINIASSGADPKEVAAAIQRKIRRGKSDS